MKAKQKQEEKKEGEKKMPEAAAKKDILPEAEEKKEAVDGDEEHSDRLLDQKLILDMIRKHMGEAGEGMEGEAEAAAHEAFQAYCEMGYSEEEAQKCAAHAMKLAKHMAAKHAEKHAEKAKEEEASKMPPGDEEEEQEAKHAEADVVKLTARIAFLERELKARTLIEVLDRKLKESGLGRAETDKLRELIGKPRSESHIDETIKVFKEAFVVRSEAKPQASSLFVVTEKRPSAEPKASAFSFGDFLKK